MVKQSIINGIQPKSTRSYSLIVIQRLNIQEEEVEGQKQISSTVMIIFLGLVHNKAKQSDPRLAWFMLHQIYHMYSDIKNKEEIISAVVLTIMSEHEESKKVNKELEDSRDNDENNQTFLQKVIIPSDLNNIQPRSILAWNCDEIGFDTK